MPPTLSLLADPLCAPERVAALGALLALPPYDPYKETDFLLRLTPERLELSPGNDASRAGTLWVDFTSVAARRRIARPGRELLVQAARVRGSQSPLAVDATAGLGRDGFLLAAAGFRVLMFERHPIVAALLADGLARARQAPHTTMIAGRIQMVAGDVLAALPTLAEQPAVIYLDPMFARRSKSAKAKQNLQLLQRLVGLETDTDELLLAALAAKPRKVVVKRPLKSPWLLGLTPSVTFRGKSVRFDLYAGDRKKGAAEGTGPA